MRDFSAPGRSVAYAGEAMVATSHPLATATALKMLTQGGSAMDAAIAAAAVLAVVEPMETGIGGDCFALYAPNGRVPPIAFNGSGRSPAAASLEQYLSAGLHEISPMSAHAVTIPGAVDAWWQLHNRFGRLDFGLLLQPAIHYARDGHPVHERVAYEWQLAKDRLTEPSAANVFLPGGQAPTTGSLFRNPALAQSLEAIAHGGRAAFYEGRLAHQMTAHLRAHGGLHTTEDFANAKGEFVEPISMRYRDHDIYQLPPNTQGVIALLILALTEQLVDDILAFDDPRRIHMCLEASRLAFEARRDLLGSNDDDEELAKRLLSPHNVGRLADRVDPRRAAFISAPTQQLNSNTVYLSVVDRDRNAASFINSVYHSFGSGLCPPETGILLQNRGVSFRLQRGHPNAIGPRRRPMHTIIPGMAGQGGRAVLSFGVMGGDYQPVGHAHVLSAILRYGFGTQQACDAPRYMPQGMAEELETGISEETCDALASMGHRITKASEPLGGAQIIAIDWERGILSGASDPRKDGCAIGI